MHRKIERITIAGVMTGTSCDGIDIATLEFDPETWVPKLELSLPYPARLRERVLRLQVPGCNPPLDEVFSLHTEIGDWIGKTLTGWIEGLSAAQRPAVIAMHGQTIAHHPKKKPHAYTVQLGDPTRVAEKTGRTVVSNFRQGDIAAGGEGAPLVPLYHYLLSSVVASGKNGIAFHNLGGISNFTYIDPSGKILACDTGPANVWIDAAMEKISRGKKHYDPSGKTALEGRVSETVLKSLLKHPYLKKSAPKSTGRDDFPSDYFFSRAKKLKGADLVATATAYSVETIGQAYERFVLRAGHPLSAIYLCGGGAKNETIRLWLSRRLPGIRVLSIEENGFESQYIEAQAFAFLGYRSLLGLPVGGSWTGVKGFSPPGMITPGRNWSEVLKSLP